MKFVCMVLIALGALLMVQLKNGDTLRGGKWLIYAALAALFSSLSSIFGKLGITEINSTLGTALRTGVIFLMWWGLVLLHGTWRQLRTISKRDACFIAFARLFTGLSWLFFYKALQTGPASIVSPIERLSIMFTAVLAHFWIGEKLNKKAFTGLICIVVGTILLVYS